MSKVIKKVAAVVAVVAAVVFSGGTALLATIGKALVTAAVSIGVSRLIAKRASTPADAGGDGGGRVQLAPATSNKLPVIYGSAFIGGSIIDAMTADNNTNIYYVIALAEHTDNIIGGGYTFDTNSVYYDGKLVQFGSNGAVTGLYTNNADPSSPNAQLDTKVNGYIYIYLFTNGSSSGVNTGGLTAQQILSTSNGIPASQAWDANKLMSNCAFAIVRVRYNQDAGTTNIGALTCKITNSIDNPADAILDYMLSQRYGCAIPYENIDTNSLSDLSTYSDELITYNTASGSPPTATQKRYTINGPIDTSQNCLNNLQFLVDSCDSWLQYSELTGKWRVVMNKSYTQAPNAQTLNQLFEVNSSNLVGGIEISPIDLNETYNEVEVAYPNSNIKDQTDYQIINLYDTDPTILSPNEAINRLNLTLPLVNNAVQAKYLAARRIYQSREDLVISFRLDFNGIQVEAGDVIRVTHEVYNWTDKLFRVSTVAETKDDSGNLFADIQAFEYTDQIYNDIVSDYIPEFNTGPLNPMIISQPGTPTIVPFGPTNATITAFQVQTWVPDQGQVKYMDFNYGVTNTVSSHTRYKTMNLGENNSFTNSDSGNAVYNPVYMNVNDLPSGNYYWSVTARNDQKGNTSNSSSVYAWAGANVTTYNPNTAIGGIQGNQIQYNTIVNNNVANYTIQGGKVANNTLTFDNMGPTLVTNGVLGTITFDILSNGLPVNVSSRTSLNQPIYLIGTDPGSSYYYPWYQGTSTTANGYNNNSTGVWQPYNASNAASLWSRYDGDWDWWVINWVYLNTSIGANIFVDTKAYMQFVSDSDTTIQLTAVFTGVGANTLYTGNDQFLHSFELKANLPLYFVYEDTAIFTGTVGGVGMMFRNLGTGSNVTVQSSDLQVYKTKR